MSNLNCKSSGQLSSRGRSVVIIPAIPYALCKKQEPHSVVKPELSSAAVETISGVRQVTDQIQRPPNKEYSHGIYTEVCKSPEKGTGVVKGPSALEPSSASLNNKIATPLWPELPTRKGPSLLRSNSYSKIVFGSNIKAKAESEIPETAQQESNMWKPPLLPVHPVISPTILQNSTSVPTSTTAASAPKNPGQLPSPSDTWSTAESTIVPNFNHSHPRDFNPYQNTWLTHQSHHPQLPCFSPHPKIALFTQPLPPKNPYNIPPQFSGETTYKFDVQDHHIMDSLSRNSDDTLVYIKGLFGDAGTADIVLFLRLPYPHRRDYHFFVHSLLMRRSPTLYHLIETSNHSQSPDQLEGGLRQVYFESADPLINPAAFEAFLLRLYGGLPINSIEDQNIQQELAGVRLRYFHAELLCGEDPMDFILSYIATTNELQCYRICEQAVELAASQLRWTTLERVLQFALKGGLDKNWYEEHGHGTNRDGGNPWSVRNGVSHSNDHVVPTSNQGPTYGDYAMKLLDQALDFIITRFPVEFEVVASYSATEIETDRQAILASREILFGRYNMFNSAPIKFKNYVLTKVLLSMPYQVLQYILNSQNFGGGPEVIPASLHRLIILDIIEARQDHQAGTTNKPPVWKEMVEDVENPEGTFSRLSRRWLASSSGNASG
ncbi:MAG: hypothetical protein M1814_003400 [Vezdaea aestivalis]|nr:MAG: hypothetical protein M1814_003400 [Vezdaea aestivalis]